MASFDTTIHYITNAHWKELALDNNIVLYGSCGAVVHDGNEWRSLMWRPFINKVFVTCPECQKHDEYITHLLTRVK